MVTWPRVNIEEIDLLLLAGVEECPPTPRGFMLAFFQHHWASHTCTHTHGGVSLENRPDTSTNFKGEREMQWKMQRQALLGVLVKPLFSERKTLYSFALICRCMHLGNLPSHTCPCPGEIAVCFDHREDNSASNHTSLILSSSLLLSTFLTQLFSDFICFHNLPCSHLLNPPSSVTFVFIPPVCLPHVSGSPRKYSKHRAPGRAP